jgi:four helix bundle protein
MKFKYEDLEIWRIALELIKLVYDKLKKFPADEKYDLISQGKRAVTSIALNIAEGSGRHTDRDFSVFINRAIFITGSRCSSEGWNTIRLHR